MKYIGNSCEAVDWKSYVNALDPKNGRKRGKDQQDDIHSNPKVAALQKVWEQAGYTDNPSVGWIDYEIPFELVEQFANWAGVTPIGGWVTSVPPGYCVPWHPDYTDREEELLSKGQVLRFTAHIGEPKWGQIFVLEDHVFHMEAQGNTYQWSDWQDWHGGMNMGLEPKFVFNFMGYPR